MLNVFLVGLVEGILGQESRDAIIVKNLFLGLILPCRALHELPILRNGVLAATLGLLE